MIVQGECGLLEGCMGGKKAEKAGYNTVIIKAMIFSFKKTPELFW